MTIAIDWVPFGFLPVLKPVGPTSHDVVAKVRKLLPRSVKVGHTGTLDPFASGVLLLGLGKATKFTDAVHQLPKTYSAHLKLGVRTNTLDPTGTVDLEAPVPELALKELAGIATQFTGTLQQKPPVFSAKRVGGKKSYELARRNKPVDLEPREVRVHELGIEILDHDLLELTVTCATGTYVRALGRDIAEVLGTCGHLVQLERTAIGSIGTDACISLDDLTPDNLPDHTLPVPDLLPEYPQIELPRVAYSYFIDGRSFRVREAMPQQCLATFKSGDGQIAAIFRCEYQAQEMLVHPKLLCYLSPAMKK